MISLRYAAAVKWSQTEQEDKRAGSTNEGWNPLKDVSNISRPAGVMVRGRWYSRAELMSELEKLARQFRPQSP